MARFLVDVIENGKPALPPRVLLCVGDAGHEEVSVFDASALSERTADGEFERFADALRAYRIDHISTPAERYAAAVAKRGGGCDAGGATATTTPGASTSAPGTEPEGRRE